MSNKATVEGVVQVAQHLAEGIEHMVDAVIQHAEHEPEKARELVALIPEIDEIVISIGIVVDHLSILRVRLDTARAKLKALARDAGGRVSIPPDPES